MGVMRRIKTSFSDTGSADGRLCGFEEIVIFFVELFWEIWSAIL